MHRLMFLAVVPNLFWCRGRISNFRVRMDPHEKTEVIITKIIKHESTYQRIATLTRKKYTNQLNVQLGIGFEL